MSQTELLYGYSSAGIALALFATIVLCNEIGYRFGVAVQSRTDEEIKALAGGVQASILGLLALLLGFTFSMSLQRYDDRSKALIDEANAIGTTILRAELLPQEQRDAALPLLQEYVATRVTMGQFDLTRLEERQAYQARAEQMQRDLWALAVAATTADPRPVTTGSFVTALNGMIDSQGKRNALQQAHVPEPILFVLFFVFVVSIGFMAYSMGLSGRRIYVPLLLVSLLITLIVFIIIDLDRPKRGVITVNQTALTSLVTPARP